MAGTKKVEAGVDVRQAGNALLSFSSGHKTIPLYQQFSCWVCRFAKDGCRKRVPEG